MSWHEAHPLLFVNAFAAGHHEGAWRMPEAEPQRLREIGYYQELARTAELGGFDALFVADFFAYYPGIAHSPRWELDPLTVLAAAAAVTETLGLIATASAIFSPAMEIARAFSTLDHVSGGRAAWNIVTSGEPRAAANYGLDRVPPHAERYAQTAAVVQDVLALWRADGGEADMPAPLQPRPVLVQAGSSPEGRDFAVRHADIVFTAQGTLASAQAFRADLHGRARALGRTSLPRVVVGLSPSIGASRAEALRKKAELDALIVPEASLAWLEGFGIDLSGHALDGPLPPQLAGEGAAFEGIRSRLGVIAEVIARERPRTVRDLLARLAGSRGHASVAGTPEDIARHIHEWHGAGAADGFMLMPHLLPRDLTDFVDQVVPLLGLPPPPQGKTLSERLGLSLGPRASAGPRHTQVFSVSSTQGRQP
ncbi:MAG: Nitrilotriacetate monooxygenase component A [Paracidovorax wautersii]|uniref:Nitrilotriacetate monooxygenase component A n=1 Tax=Paracidovorax wautersii TaxID=1177982 RepID=A0A7V8JRP6_9BURK|nr:MAG: Nitrilotriacetate monooxygenase component A [Paracidovorax wautersii]